MLTLPVCRSSLHSCHTCRGRRNPVNASRRRRDTAVPHCFSLLFVCVACVVLGVRHSRHAVSSCRDVGRHARQASVLESTLQDMSVHFCERRVLIGRPRKDPQRLRRLVEHAARLSGAVSPAQPAPKLTGHPQSACLCGVLAHQHDSSFEILSQGICAARHLAMLSRCTCTAFHLGSEASRRLRDAAWALAA
jgi:hypothetical protein